MLTLTRPVPDSIARCELTHLTRVAIDVEKAREQHRGYERALAALGCTVRPLAPAHDLPDSVFIEDTAVVLDELAVITRPGAASRRSETAGVAEALAGFRSLRAIGEPATLDGGDVLRLGRTLYVGAGGRTNSAGVEQLASFVGPAGYDVCQVAIRGCLHLKSAVTELAPGLLIVNPAWVDAAAFDGHDFIPVDRSEPSAANVLSIGGTVLCQASCPRTTERLEAAGLRILGLDLSELAKAEGGMTCCSLMIGSV